MISTGALDAFGSWISGCISKSFFMLILAAFIQRPLSCDNRSLYDTHPQSQRSKYHHPSLAVAVSRFDAGTERMFDELCRQATGYQVNSFDCNHYFTSDGYVLDCHSRKRDIVEKILQQYWANLQHERQVDFELILFYAYQLITTVPSISILLGSLFSSILVDEYQDTKEIQYAILGAILKASGGQATAFIVGDLTKSRKPFIFRCAGAGNISQIAVFHH